MADKITKGKNVRLKIGAVGSTVKKIFHATECNITASRTIEGVATKDSEGDVNVPGSYTWSASLNTLVAEKDPATDEYHSFKEVYQAFLGGTEQDFEYTTGEVGDMIFSGKVYITQADMNAPTAGAATGSFTFTGNGNLTLIAVPA